MFLATIMRPTPADVRIDNPKILRIAEAPFTVLRGPPGSFVAEWLAAAVEAWERWPTCVWLRTATSKPGTLARRLAEACEYRWTSCCDRDSDQQAPHERLAQALDGSPAGAVVVLELPGTISRGVRRLLADIRLTAADRGISVVAVTESRLPRAMLNSFDHVLPSSELWEPAALGELTSLPRRSWRRLVDLARQRPAVVADIQDAAAIWPTDVIADALDVSGRLLPTLDRLTAQLLDLCSGAQRDALEMCLNVGYWHPQFGTEIVRAGELRPWVVPLEGDWGWLRPMWVRSLSQAFARGVDLGSHTATGFGLVSPVRPPAAAARQSRREAAHDTLLEARLLGSFELRIDRSAVTWSGRRGVSVLRYLLARRHHSCSRDQLIEEFWPNTKPLVARNRLQVAVSGLRQGLRDHTPLQVIEYVDGGYRINPEVQVTVDVEQFESAVSRGRAAERSGDAEAALTAYREVMELYRGDFAADAPFEQWTLLPRESLRLAYLDALDRMSRILFGIGRLDECIATGNRMLDLDPCREDAYRMLMRCYARQGRPYQALRQFELCSRMLREILSTGPTPETMRIYKLIRAGSRPTDAPLR